MLELGLACDGGKDSLSMAASAGGETVMAPGNLVVSAYVGCPDITQVSHMPCTCRQGCHGAHHRPYNVRHVSRITSCTTFELAGTVHPTHRRLHSNVV